MTNKSCHRGFSLVGVLIAILAVVLLAGSGWYIWQKNKDSNSKQTNGSSSQNGDSNKDNQNNTKDPSDPSEGGKYLVISEWGVRFELPEQLRGDITYFVNDKAAQDFGGSVRVDLLSGQFSKGNLKCSVIENGTPRSLVSIYRETEGDGATQEPLPFKNVAGIRYYFATTACEETINSEGSAQDKQLLASLKNAVRDGLEAIHE